MPVVTSNGLQIAYETHGDLSGPTVIMVQGLSMPLTGWPPPLIDALVADGFHVITFDNRDIGHSQLMDDMPVPNMLLQILRRMIRLKVKAPYRLDDMMRDVVGLMDALEIESAHLIGVSMGGMISQLLAIHEPQRVKSLTSIMSTTNDRKLPGPTKALTRHYIRGPAAKTDEAGLAFMWQTWRLLGSPKYPLSDEELSEFLRAVLTRGMTAAGTARQTLAILAAPGRVADLKRLKVPTLIIHGEEDPLIPIECGLATARAIPGSRMISISGMGHDLPLALLPRISRQISQHLKACD